MTRLLIIGPPGSGKGTQAEHIARHFGVPTVSTGEIFRTNVSEETPLGLEAVRLDHFLLTQFDLNVAATVQIVSDQARAMGSPRVTEDELLRRLARSGAPRFSEAVEAAMAACTGKPSPPCCGSGQILSEAGAVKPSRRWPASALMLSGTP